MRKIRNPAAEIPLPGFEVFYEDFLASRKDELIELMSAVSRDEFKALAQMAHKWKGFSSPYGFQELAELAVLLEDAANEENNPECSRLLQEIGAYLGVD